MRKLIIAVAAGFIMMGTTVTTKAASLIKGADVSYKKYEDNNLVLKHAKEIFGNERFAVNQHASHSSHVSHASHNSHNSHNSHSSHSSHYSGY